MRSRNRCQLVCRRPKYSTSSVVTHMPAVTTAAQETGLTLGSTSPFQGWVGVTNCRPNLIGNPSAGRGSRGRAQLANQWFNPNAFEPNFGMDPNVISAITTGYLVNGSPADFNQIDQLWALGTAGLRLGGARSPGYWNVDMALGKDFRLSENKYLEFRLEGYNILNHQNLALPNAGWCLPPNPDGSTDAVHQFGCQFGRITNVQSDARNWQFALKFIF